LAEQKTAIFILSFVVDKMLKGISLWSLDVFTIS